MARNKPQHLSDLHMAVLSWLSLHPDHRPEAIAHALGADVADVERLYADLVMAGFIKPMTTY